MLLQILDCETYEGTGKLYDFTQKKWVDCHDCNDQK